MSKKTVMKARSRLKKARVTLASFKRRSRKEMARMSAQMKRHERALKIASKRYKSARA
jgi:hypothetical protein